MMIYITTNSLCICLFLWYRREFYYRVFVFNYYLSFLEIMSRRLVGLRPPRGTISCHHHWCSGGAYAFLPHFIYYIQNIQIYYYLLFSVISWHPKKNVVMKVWRKRKGKEVEATERYDCSLLFCEFPCGNEC